MDGPPPTIDYHTPRPPDGPRTDPLAIVSVVSGSLSFAACLAVDLVGLGGFAASFLLGVVAVATAVAAAVRTSTFRRIRIERKTPPFVGGGLARGGLLMGIVAVCMMVFVVPQLGRARESANRVKCASNLRQIGQGLRQYAIDHGGVYPPDLDTLLTYAGSAADVLLCPRGDERADDTPPYELGVDCSYAMFALGTRERRPQDEVLATCDPRNHPPRDSATTSGANVLFADGSVEFLEEDEFLAALAASAGSQSARLAAAEGGP